MLMKTKTTTEPFFKVYAAFKKHTQMYTTFISIGNNYSLYKHFHFRIL